MAGTASATVDRLSVLAAPLTSAAGDVGRWYALYTRSRHEKSIAQQLEGRGFEYFLPLFEALHRWKDRSMRVSVPLFPGYIFVHMSRVQRREVVCIPGVVAIVGTHAGPTAIAEDELNALRTCIAQRARFQPCPYLAIGRKGRIISGPLADVEGILLRRRGRLRMVLSITLISRSVEVEVDANTVVALDPCCPAPPASRAGPALAA